MARSARDRPFRFGVMLGAAASRAEWRAKVRSAEAIGFDVVLVADHPAHQPLAPIPALAAAAEATERLRVGTLVLCNDLHHPVTLANELATLDLLTDGRLEVGIGAGWLEADYAALGVPFDPPPIRIARLAEAIDLTTRLWSGEEVAHEGAHYQVAGLHGVPKPVQQPHPPLLVGGGGRRVMELAGRVADIVGIAPNMRSGRLGPDSASTATPAATRAKVEAVREAAGARFDALELQANVTFVRRTDDFRGQAEKVGRVYGVDADEAPAIVHALFGTPQQMADQLRARREELAISYLTVPEPAMRDLAPVIELLADEP